MSTNNNINTESHRLVIYQDDFAQDKVWRDVCNCLNIDPDHGDRLVIYCDSDFPASITTEEDEELEFKNEVLEDYNLYVSQTIDMGMPF